MANDIAVLERQLVPMAPHFEQALAGVMPVDRLIRTAIISAERNPFLMECDRQSFFNTIMSAGVLGLEMDGVTGQAFPIPFKRKVQLVIGYKGYNTLGARAGLTITGEVVRDGDDFDYLLGTGAFVHHKPRLGNKGKIIGAWAQADANGRPPVIAVLGIDELMAIKLRSPGAKRDDSPWNNPDIGFPAMCSKSVKRRLCRSTPLNVMQLAARMEEAFEEQGKHAFIGPDRSVIVEGEIVEPQRTSETPTAEALIKPPSIDDLKAEGAEAAEGGIDVLKAWSDRLSPKDRAALKPYIVDTLKPLAQQADERAGAAA